MTDAFGQFFKKVRIRGRKTLRQFCLDNGFDPSNISRLERGLQPPPRSKTKLMAYAAALGIKEGTDDWIEFFDLAAVGAGRLPAAIMDDAEVVGKLPVLLRTIHNKRLDADKLDELIERIRRA